MPLSTQAVSFHFYNLIFSYLERQIFNGSVNTTKIEQVTGVAAKQDSIQQSYGIPTIKLLNPELFKIQNKVNRQMRDPIYQSLKNIKERHTYLENRQ